MSISMIELVMALLVGMLLGIGLYWWMYQARVNKAKTLDRELERREQELSEVREQLQHMVQRDRETSDYKSKVDDHFVETAALINQMTQSYKAVYDHLEKGAISLVGKENLQKRLANVQAQPVKLEYIGLSSQTDLPEVGYVVVVEQTLPENEALQQRLAEALDVTTQDVPEALHNVMTEAMAKNVEKILREFDIEASLKPMPELF
jgi:uncharacterized membrane-anchored protein YhcB (DUF1043 family)